MASQQEEHARSPIILVLCSKEIKKIFTRKTKGHVLLKKILKNLVGVLL